MPQNENNLPRLEGLFFAVCQTAIKNTSWKYADFEKVKTVEGQLEALRLFFVSFYEREQMAKEPAETSMADAVDQGIAIPEPEIISKPVEEPNPSDEIELTPIQKEIPAPAEEIPAEQKKNLVSPEQAKEAPARPMPDDIFDIVKAGVEVARVAPKMKDKVQAQEIPVAQSAADVERNKLNYHNISNDINDALEPGEHYLTPAEAKARRQKIIEERKNAGLEVFN